LPLGTIRRQVGPLSLTTSAIGAFLQDTGLYPVDAMRHAVRSFRAPKIARASEKALNMGAALIREP
jgi:hypothetical protein